MYLKSIEITGFKSFANKTVFRFDEGITAIVGPNGSGKSNVADAVRWVLGEQRVKQLRGGNMQDVIFAGTAARKPQGYAAVAITLDNSEHSLNLPYEEVTVTRRLYRSGESEYLINGTQCRLKDINELFYDTGIGKEGYSIIGQGQVERILNGKPEERRELFDEAAGIVKFKRRKYEALKKLDSEQLNLQRVNDVLSELDRQIGPLSRQSEKAKIYLAKRDQLKAFDVNLFLAQLEETQKELEETKSAQEDVGAQLELTKQEADNIRSRYEEASGRLDEIEAQQEQQQERLSEMQLAKADSEHRLEMLHAKEQQETVSFEIRENRIKELKEQAAARQKDLEALENAVAGLDEQARELQQKIGETSDARTDVTKEILSLEEAVEEHGRRQISLINDRTLIHTRQQHNDTMLEQLKLKQESLSDKLAQLRSDLSSRESTCESLRAKAEAVAKLVETVEKRSIEKNEILSVVQEELTGLNQQIEQDQLAYHQEVSRLESLRNIAERYDGYGNSIRKVMEQRGREKGICGVVADLITTKKNYETAIETALGGSIQNIVTTDEETAKRMIAFLKENRYGRATFLPLTAMKKTEPFRQTGALNEKGVIGLASTLVRTEARYAVLTAHLLGKTLVVDNIDNAVALARKFKYSLRIVTLEGELLNPGGSMTGGAFKNSSNLLGRRREMDELKAAVEKKKQLLESSREKIDETRARRNALRDEIRELSEQLQQHYLERNTVTLQLQEMEAHQDEVLSSQDEMLKEREEAKQDASRIDEDQEKIRQQLADSMEQENSLISETEDFREKAESLKAKEEELAQKLQSLHVEAASAAQRREYLLLEQQRIRNEAAQASEEEASLVAACALADEEKEQRSGQEKELQKEIEERAETVEQIQRKLTELASMREQLGKSQKQFFDEREQISQQASLLDREHIRLTNRIEKLEENREERIAYMWEEYELTPVSAASFKRDDLGGRSTWKRQMGVLRKEIRELGNVNVNAIEEYKEVQERHAFLHTQRDDIVSAQEALEKIISQLDTGMKKQFREQFARICEEFNKSFKLLFGGGQGTLELVEDENILEAGIRIIAQPPGKKLQNMMQLSGGEKALTAIALLFAIQNLKPSPFCLLDEIEAALDENNVERYADYLRKLTKNTQFIIITHRRGTMTSADRLYGVTMQEKGVSALVSVSLIEQDLDK